MITIPFTTIRARREILRELLLSRFGVDTVDRAAAVARQRLEATIIEGYLIPPRIDTR